MRLASLPPVALLPVTLLRWGSHPLERRQAHPADAATTATSAGVSAQGGSDDSSPSPTPSAVAGADASPGEQAHGADGREHKARRTSPPPQLPPLCMQAAPHGAAPPAPAPPAPTVRVLRSPPPLSVQPPPRAARPPHHQHSSATPPVSATAFQPAASLSPTALRPARAQPPSSTPTLAAPALGAQPRASPTSQPRWIHRVSSPGPPAAVAIGDGNVTLPPLRHASASAPTGATPMATVAPHGAAGSNGAGGGLSEDQARMECEAAYNLLALGALAAQERREQRAAPSVDGSPELEEQPAAAGSGTGDAARAGTPGEAQQPPLTGAERLLQGRRRDGDDVGAAAALHIVPQGPLTPSPPPSAPPAPAGVVGAVGAASEGAVASPAVGGLSMPWDEARTAGLVAAPPLVLV